MTDVLKEITPLSDKDLFYIVERHKSEFIYPVHQHRDFELNFVEHANGAERVVGDSIEEIGEFDLVLIGGRTSNTRGNREDAPPGTYARLPSSSPRTFSRSPFCQRRSSLRSEGCWSDPLSAYPFLWKPFWTCTAP